MPCSAFDLDQQAVKDFLTLVLYRHATALDSDVKEKSVAQFERYVCDQVFASSEAYLEIVRASEGNPRDFLSLLAVCCTTASQRTATLSQKDAVHLAISHFNTSKRPNIQDDVAANLYQKIFENVVSNKQKLFLLSASKASRDARIQTLLHYRFLHLVAPVYTVVDESGLPKDYSVFSMDYGKLLALKANKAGERVLETIRDGLRTMGNVAFIFGGDLLRSALDFSLKKGGLQEKLIEVAGRTVVGSVEIADLDSDTLLAKCVYDRLLNS